MTSGDVACDLSGLEVAAIVAMFEEYLASTTDVAHKSVMSLIASKNSMNAARMRHNEPVLIPYCSLLFSDMLKRSARAGQARQFLELLISMYPPHEDAMLQALRERILGDPRDSNEPDKRDWPDGDPDSY